MSSRLRTLGTLMMSRMTVTSNGSATPRRPMLSKTSDPVGPRIISTDLFTGRSRIDSPSIFRITSPASSPAASAGEPSIGAMMVI